LITSARPGREFPRRQAAQGVQIGQHQARLMERPDHVLARRVVDGRLAAHRRIDERQQGGRHLNEIDATLVDGRGKSGHVADHTAAEGHDQAPAVESRLQQRIEDAVQAVPGLVGFTGRQGHGQQRGSVIAQAGAQPGLVQRAHSLVGDDRHLTAAGQRAQGIALSEQTGLDQDGVAAFGEGNLDRSHGCGSLG
jgi:hypothetical protein